MAAPLPCIAIYFLWRQHANAAVWLGVLFLLLALVWFAETTLAERLLRPLQTLANIVVALRTGDYSLRVRGGRRNDTLGDLAIEINALANDLQAQRLTSLESSALVRSVLASIDAPVFGFDRGRALRLLNPAAQRLLPAQSIGRDAAALGLAHALDSSDGGLLSLGSSGAAVQWLVRRSSFRLEGVPLTLLLLSDVSRALRDEERQAWQRLIRVLGHEINNSLTPIKSLAGSLRILLTREPLSQDEFDRALLVIEDRADSLNRFLAAYRQLAQLPIPRLCPVSLRDLLTHVAALETRVAVRVETGADLLLAADPDQLAQALINLVRNAAEAVLLHPLTEDTSGPPTIVVQWHTTDNRLHLLVLDSGPGISNSSNLFVPFYTTKEHGTGLGLLLVKQIAEAHGGSITLRNRDGGSGACAELVLPLDSVTMLTPPAAE